MTTTRAPWSDIEEWVTASIRAARGGAVDPRLERLNSDGVTMAVLSGEEVSRGGALIPAELVGDLQIQPITQLALADHCRTWQMRSNKRSVPAMFTADHDAGAPFGATVTWEGDTADLSENKAKLKTQDIGLEAKNLNGYLEVKNTFVEDSAVEIADVVEAVYSDVMTWELNRMIIRGKGGAQPVGIINGPSTITTARATADTFGFADIEGMLAALLPSCLERATFLAHPTAIGKLYTRFNQRGITRLAGSRDISSVWMDFAPIVPSNHCSVLGTAGDLILADLSAYYVGIRQQVVVAMSGLGPGFTKNMTGVRVTCRVDGQPGIVSTVDPVLGDTEQSAFVVLGAA